jgi:hypothetical protein
MVVPVVVDPVDRQSFGISGRESPGSEDLKILPLGTDFNPPTAIPGVFIIGWDSATALHLPPHFPEFFFVECHTPMISAGIDTDLHLPDALLFTSAV